MRETVESKKVLLVDDNRQQFLQFGCLLSNACYNDYRLIWCHDLEKYLDHIEHHQCDVVLLDYHWENYCKDFIRRSYTLNSKIPIILMTDDMDPEVDKKAISVGASDYLVKGSITADVLERTLRYSLERKKLENHFIYLAHHDYLTGLANRTLFLDRLEQTIQLADRANDKFTLMFVDLNNFKVVNDNYGHEMGDRLLKEFSARLIENVRSSDTVGRIGGDEFMILFNHIGSTPQIISLAQKLIDSIRSPFVIKGQELFVGCSIGIAVYPDSGESAEVMKRNADVAMYQAKLTGTSCYRFFSSAKNEFDCNSFSRLLEKAKS